MPGGTVNTCSGNFYDTGGNGGSYNNNQNITTTFCPSVAGQCVTLNFSSLNIESNYDYLYVYNGPNTGSPQFMGSPFTGTSSPGVLTSTAAGGCITVRFTSDGSITSSGWAATISCAACGAPPPCTGTTPACASPPPDACPGACNLGSLSSPPACPSTTAVTNVFCLNNSGATAESPYSSLIGCVPSGNMPSPSADVWYRFTATTTMFDISIQGLSSPSVGVYQGTNCGNLIGRWCANGSGGNLSTTVDAITPGATYYLQISGGNTADQGNFTLTMTSYNDCNDCMLASNLTVSPSPVNGQFSAGQTVNFCYNVTQWNQSAVNWLHGVVLTFSGGWNTATLTTTPPASCDGLGNWAWYNSVMGSTTGLTFGPGFFYDSPLGNLGGPYPDGNPGDNYGDDCEGAVNWNFCWSIQTGTCPPQTDGANLGISINTLGDYESGAWSSGGCETDAIYTYSGTLNCCAPPTAVINQNVSCFGGNNGQATATGVGTAPFSYLWNDPPPAQATATVTGLTAGTWTVTVTDNDGCVGTASVTITQPAAVVPTITKTDLSCNGVCNGTLSATAAGGTPTYTYNWSGGLGSGANKTNVCAGVYTVTVTDSKGCTGTASVTITQPSILSLTLTPTNESCDGLCDGSGTASASGGTPTYTYSWSNGCMGSSCASLCDGAYTVTVTDSKGCTAMGTVTINPGPVIIAGFTYNGNQCLSGNSYNFTNTGTMGVTYSWSFTGGSPATSSSENPLGITWSAPGTYTVTQTVSSGSCMNTSTLNITVYPQPTVSLAKTDITCNGLCNGSVSATAASGTAPYTYNWNNGCMGSSCNSLCMGTYTVTVTDANGCTATGNIAVTEPPVLAVTMSNTNASCNNVCNAMGTATVSGGTPGYTYQWSAGAGFQTTSTATGLCDGTFSVTVTDSKGCTAAGTITVTEPAAITVNVTPSNSTCGASTGSVTAAAGGGCGTYTYAWNNGCMGSNCTGLAAGTYTVTVTDACSCTQTANGTVNDAGGISASIVIDQNITCFSLCNGQATASVAGGSSPFTYVWNIGATVTSASTSQTQTGLCGGNISVTVTDAFGCASSGAGVITEPSQLIAISTVTPESCNGSCDGIMTISASGGLNPYTYAWPGGPTGPVPSKNTLCSGPYTVTVYDAYGCSTTVTGNIAAGGTLSLSIAGNTASCFNQCNASANLTVSGGSAPFTYAWSNLYNGEDPSGLCDGSYTVTVTDSKGCTATSNVSLTEPSAVTVTVSNTPATCGQANGTATATGGGGNGGYSYTWNTSPAQNSQTATGLAGGVYSVTVTDSKGCTATGSTTVNNVAGGSVSATTSGQVTCFGLCNGSATVSMSGGTAPYTYLWNTTPAQNTPTATGLCAGIYTVTVTDGNTCSGTASVTLTQPLILGASVASSTDLVCYNVCTGSVTFSPVGGTPPYTYQWNPVVATGSVATGLCAGTYGITISDANACTVTISRTITQPPQLTAVTSGTAASCSGVCDGTAAVTEGGGTPAYSYSWSNSQTASSATGLCGGSTVTVTVTDSKGCTATGNYTVNTLADIILTVTVTDATCGQSNGQVSVSVTNGTPAYTYTWNTACISSLCTGLTSGNYSVTVTDSKGCSATTAAAISNAVGPSVIVSATVPPDCFGDCDGSITILVTDGVPPYTYQWNTTPPQNGPTATGLCAGTWGVTVYDANSCLTTLSPVLTQPPLLVISSSNATNVSCFGQCTGSIGLTVTGGTPAYSYQWSSGQTSSAPTGLCSGSYGVTVTDSKGCTATSSAVITQPTQLFVTVVSDSTACAGVCNGTATATAGGGSPAYSYLWSDGSSQSTPIAVNLCSGNYTITVTDSKSCTTTGNTGIYDPVSLIASITSYGNVTCKGDADGWAQSAPTGGTPPYTYQWSNGQGGSMAVNLSGEIVFVTITDANGCWDSASVMIYEPPQLVVVVYISNATCYGVCDGWASLDVTGGISPYSYLWDASAQFQTTQIATGLCADMYYVTVTDNNGCTQTASALITEPQALAFTETVTNSTCGNPNGSACISAIGGIAPFVFVWDTVLNITGSCLNNVNAGVYNPIVYDDNGCSFTAPVLINDIAGPTVDSVTGTDASCYGAFNGTLTGYVSSGTQPFTYIWMKGGDTVSTGSTFVPGMDAGTYTFTVIDANGCLTSGFFTISEPPMLFSAILSVTNVTCNSQCNGELTAGLGGGSAPYTYAWNITPQQDSSTATGLCAGNYNVIITDANGCTSTTSSVITEPQAIAIVPVVDSVNCSGNCDGSISLIPTPTGGTPPYNIVWLPPGYGSGPVITNLCTGIYTAIINDSKGCSMALDIPVAEPPPLTASMTTLEARCGLNNGSAAVFAFGGTPDMSSGSPEYDYLWIPGGYTASIVTTLSAGPYTVYVTDMNGCVISVDTTIINIPPPVINALTVQNNLCYGEQKGIVAVSFINPSQPPYSFTWNTGSPDNDTAYSLPAGQVIVTVSDGNTCTIIDTTYVLQPTPVTVTLTPDQTICYGQSASLTVTATGGIPPFTYTWDNSLPQGSIQSVSPLSTTVYNVTATDQNGCDETASVTITVIPPLLVDGQTINICSGEDVVLTANAYGGDGSYAYEWQNGQPGPTFNLINVTSSVTISVTASDGCSLDDTAQYNIIVNPLPVADFLATEDKGCKPFPTAFTDLSTVNPGAIQLWYWDFGDGTTSSLQNPTHIYSDEGTYDVSLIVVTTEGCSDTVIQYSLINVSPVPDAFFTAKPDITTLINALVQFNDGSTVGSGGEIISWSWNFGDPFADDTAQTSGLQNPQHEYSDTGTYLVTLIVTTADSCPDIYIDTIRIKSEYILFAPSAITPDGDGLNDFFFPSVIGLNEDRFEMYIFDRWGDLIYETKDINKPWDGKANKGATLVQQDVYVWLIRTEDLNGVDHSYIGHVSVIK